LMVTELLSYNISVISRDAEQEGILEFKSVRITYELIQRRYLVELHLKDSVGKSFIVLYRLSSKTEEEKQSFGYQAIFVRSFTSGDLQSVANTCYFHDSLVLWATSNNEVVASSDPQELLYFYNSTGTVAEPAKVFCLMNYHLMLLVYNKEKKGRVVILDGTRIGVSRERMFYEDVEFEGEIEDVEIIGKSKDPSDIQFHFLVAAQESHKYVLKQYDFRYPKFEFYPRQSKRANRTEPKDVESFRVEVKQDEFTVYDITFSIRRLPSFSVNSTGESGMKLGIVELDKYFKIEGDILDLKDVKTYPPHIPSQYTIHKPYQYIDSIDLKTMNDVESLYFSGKLLVVVTINRALMYTYETDKIKEFVNKASFNTSYFIPDKCKPVAPYFTLMVDPLLENATKPPQSHLVYTVDLDVIGMREIFIRYSSEGTESFRISQPLFFRQFEELKVIFAYTVDEMIFYVLNSTQVKKNPISAIARFPVNTGIEGQIFLTCVDLIQIKNFRPNQTLFVSLIAKRRDLDPGYLTFLIDQNTGEIEYPGKLGRAFRPIQFSFALLKGIVQRIKCAVFGSDKVGCLFGTSMIYDLYVEFQVNQSTTEINSKRIIKLYRPSQGKIEQVDFTWDSKMFYFYVINRQENKRTRHFETFLHAFSLSKDDSTTESIPKANYHLEIIEYTNNGFKCIDKHFMILNSDNYIHIYENLNRPMHLEITEENVYELNLQVKGFEKDTDLRVAPKYEAPKVELSTMIWLCSLLGLFLLTYLFVSLKYQLKVEDSKFTGESTEKDEDTLALHPFDN
jgi:hypothetical protein